MSKKFKVLSIVAAILVVALTFGAIALLKDDSLSGDGEKVSTVTASEPIVMRDVSPEFSMSVIAEGINASDLSNYVSVTGPEGAIDYNIVDNGNGRFDINAPEGGYIAGASYEMLLADPVVFNVNSAVANARSILFIIAKAESNDIVYKDNVVELEAGSFEMVGNQIALDNSNVVAGTIVLVPVGVRTEAYKVSSVACNGAVNVLTVSKDLEADEIFDKIDVKKDLSISDGDLEFDEEALVAQIENSGIVMAIEDLGFLKPNISIPVKSIDKEAGKAYIDIKLVFSGDSGFSFQIYIGNVIDIQPHVNYSTVPFTFDLSADMKTVTTTTVSIVYGASQSAQYNAEEVVAQLAELAKTEVSETTLKAFKWSYPIGPLFLSYDLDLKLSFEFAGRLDVVTTSVSDYTLGATYIDGNFEAYADKNAATNFELDSIGIFGELGAKAGIVNGLSLEIFQIARVGLELETGLYLDMWGAAQVNKETGFNTVNAGFYGDFGFYYEVRILVAAGIAIGSKDFKIDKNLWSIGDKISFFDFGDKMMYIGYVDVQPIEMSSSKEVVPTFKVKEYNLVTKQYSVTELDYDANEYVLPLEPAFSLKDGIITANTNESFDQELTIKLKNTKISTTLQVIRNADKPYAVNAIQEFNKSDAENIFFNIDLIDTSVNSIVSVSGSGLTVNDYIVNYGYQVEISKDFLIQKTNGTYTFTVQTTDGVISLWVEVVGTVGLFSVGNGTPASPWLIYSPEQVVALSDAANISATSSYNYKQFKLMCNIDMNGAVVTPISTFLGTFDGNGYTIRNFTVNGTNGNAGLIEVNKGTVKNLTVDAVIDVNAKVIKAGAIAAVNADSGIIENCLAKGSVKAVYKTGATKHSDIKVGGVVGVNEGTITGVTAQNSVYVKSYGSSISSTVYAAGVVGYNSGSLSGAVANNSVTNETVKWQDSVVNAIANNK